MINNLARWVKMGKNIHLNSAVNRFRLNSKTRIGSVIDAISIVMPFNEEEWKEYYFKNVKSESDLNSVGSELYKKIIEIILPEIQSIEESDCQDYIRNLVIRETLHGYRTRITILNTLLIKRTGKEFHFLPDFPNDYKYRTYKIDYYFVDETKDLLIGVKAQPYSILHAEEAHIKRALEEIKEEHKRWEEKNAGRFFIIYYTGKPDDCKIQNEDVLEEISAL